MIPAIRPSGKAKAMETVNRSAVARCQGVVGGRKDEEVDTGVFHGSDSVLYDTTQRKTPNVHYGL